VRRFVFVGRTPLGSSAFTFTAAPLHVIERWAADMMADDPTVVRVTVQEPTPEGVSRIVSVTERLDALATEGT
jgi:hypothetical protein